MTNAKFKTLLTEGDLHALKRRIGLALPDAGHAKAIELTARILGFNTYAALRAALRERGHVVADASALDAIHPDDELVEAAIACHCAIPEKASDRPLGAADALKSLRTALAPFDALCLPPPATESERIAALITKRVDVPATEIAPKIANLVNDGPGGTDSIDFWSSPAAEPVATATIKRDGHENAPDIGVLEVRITRKVTDEADENLVLEILACARRTAMAKGLAIVVTWASKVLGPGERLGGRHLEPFTTTLGKMGYADISGFWQAGSAWIAKPDSAEGVTPWRLPEEHLAA